MNVLLMNRMATIENLIGLLDRGYDEEKTKALHGEIAYTARRINEDMIQYDLMEQSNAINLLQKVRNLGISY